MSQELENSAAFFFLVFVYRWSGSGNGLRMV